MIQIEQEADGRWLADLLTHPGTMAYGKTPHEALDNLMSVLITTLEAK